MPAHELYEAPEPWGPWSLMASKDFGGLGLSTSTGEYGTSIPSKFISADGKTLAPMRISPNKVWRRI